ncbi:hypothetical protein SAMN05216323_10585 [Williamwhitmania taraxaci]|uniref:Uncharacterized protein n=1 Tax=Williamwhitmania taraxaci TaxID=1640674 RepID=A0A1G6Q5T0_9BACT|nr:hypothetical protein SAMN05216323_10585 [Williamwhitmania taraxaci]
MVPLLSSIVKVDNQFTILISVNNTKNTLIPAKFCYFCTLNT